MGPLGDIIANQAVNSQELITLGQTFGCRVAQFLTKIVGRKVTHCLWATLSKQWRLQFL